jgi:hypothetical protein
MGQSSKNAVVKDAQTLLSKGEYVQGMGQRSNYAVVKDVLFKLEPKEYAGGMVVVVGQMASYAAVWDAQGKSGMEMCALDMGPR